MDLTDWLIVAGVAAGMLWEIWAIQTESWPFRSRKLKPTGEGA